MDSKYANMSREEIVELVEARDNKIEDLSARAEGREANISAARQQVSVVVTELKAFDSPPPWMARALEAASNALTQLREMDT